MNSKVPEDKIWALAKEEILMAFHFLVNATGHFLFVRSEGAGPLPMTDGRYIYYDPQELIRIFREKPSDPAHILMHMLLHCLFGHPFRRQIAEPDIWDAACDLAVEAVVADLAAGGEMGEAFLPADTHREDIFFRVRGTAPHMTAEEIYNACMDGQIRREELLRRRELFLRDSHVMWQSSVKQAGRAKNSAKGGEAVPADQDDAREQEGGRADEKETPEDLQNEKLLERQADQLRQRWQKLARQAQMELSSFRNRYGRKAGHFTDQLTPILWEEVDYSEFLRNFGSEQEILHISDDAFDIAYYKYGLEIYGNIPLIEPLEFSEEHRIRTFVIAIDTSGSVQGEIVQTFLQKTCDVLRSTGSFTRMVDILLIQCDAEVQSVRRISDMDELEDVIKDLHLRGFGGTDFRPVFEYIEQLRAEHKMEKPDGLLYFTDGVGTNPEKAPDYKTAFIFHRDDHISPKVPSWAIRAVLSTDTIRLLSRG